MSHNDKIQESLKNVIMEQLPQMAGGMMGNEIERLQKMERDFTVMREDYRSLQEAHDKLHQRMTEKEERYHDLNRREERVADKEESLVADKQKLFIKESLIDMRESHANDRVLDSKETLSLVFRNNYTQRSIHTSGFETNGSTATPAQYDEHGSLRESAQHHSHTEHVSKTTTITEEEK